MATIKPPYADPGRASFEELDTYTQGFLLAGSHPELKPAFSFALPNSVTYAQFLVVGLNAARKLVPATSGVAAAAATGSVAFSGTGTDGDTITIGGVVYTLKDAVDETASAAYDVLIGGSAAATAANLVAAINGAGTEGTEYAEDTLPHPDVSAVLNTATVNLTARSAGDNGNEIALAESGSGTTVSAALMSGGKDAGGVQAIGVLAHAASLGVSGTANGQVFYSGCFNKDALVWDDSFDTDAKKLAAFFGAPTPTTIIVAERAA